MELNYSHFDQPQESQCKQPFSLIIFPPQSGHLSPVFSSGIYLERILHIAEENEAILSFTFLAVLTIYLILVQSLK